MPELNDIKINLGDLRKSLASLQQDGYEEIGLEDLLRFIYASTHRPIPVVSPLRAKSQKKGGEKVVS